MIARILTSGTLVQDMRGVIVPCQVTFRSSNFNWDRKIELSYGGHECYFRPLIDESTPNKLVFVLKNRIDHIKVTGAPNDILIIL